ncbi:hypothetical protein TNCV_3546481 [Trichonephila clavipes]|nr:hypothetical protein TNCV_3546481 [Trichonephila clavipes]
MLLQRLVWDTPPVATLDQLWKCVKAAWTTVPQGYIQSIFDSIPSYTRAFGDGPRNFEPWSSDVDDTLAVTPSPNYHTTPTGGRFSSRQI